MAAETDGGETTDYENLMQRHKKEKKELQAKIQSLKHGIPKGDKKRKKEVTAEISMLEAKLDEKHAQEINKCQAVTNGDENEIVSEINSMEIKENNPKQNVTRAQKRRDKKAALEKEREQRIKEAEAENVFSSRNVEETKLKDLLQPLGLVINEIPPDGHCLYKAIADQLQTQNIKHDHKSLRQFASKYMLDHQDEFIPFLVDQETGISYSPEQFVKYCEDVCETATWGGQLEIQAISNCLEVPVKIFQAEGPVIEIGKQHNSSREILLSYHHHAYGLGEHYNSVIPGGEDCLNNKFHNIVVCS